MITYTLVDENPELLYQEFLAVFDEVQLNDNPLRITIYDVGATQGQIDAIVLAHDNSQFSTEQQIDQAKALVEQGKQYLRNQYLNSSPSVPTIYTTLSTTIASNVFLQQIMDNQIAIYQLETGFSLASITTNADRARYIECVRRVVALLT